MILIDSNITKNASIHMDWGKNGSSTTDFLRGTGGRKYTVKAANNTVNPIITVEPTRYENVERYDKSVVIENLVIDGDGKGVTGIMLDNVVASMIRNITIKNCDVGIHLHNHDGYWSECNCLKNIYMENVKKGILFTASGKHPTEPDPAYPGDSAAFTTVDNVSIVLDNSSTSVGIQVGDDAGLKFIKPYSSRIRASVLLGSNGGTGLKVTNGELQFGQSHLTVTRQDSGSGTGIDISMAISKLPSQGIIWRNQFSTFNSGNGNLVSAGFMLVTSNISTPINPSNAVANGKADVLLKSF